MGALAILQQLRQRTDTFRRPSGFHGDHGGIGTDYQKVGSDPDLTSV
jgi:hypothetical protein